MASTDERISAAAVVGSFAAGVADRWSDLDLTFAVREGIPVSDVLEEWTHRLSTELRAIVLFDLPSGPTIYRVLLFTGGLQVDLSFTPEAEFRPRAPAFQVIFGSAGPLLAGPPPPARYLFGVAVHHAVRIRVSLERRRYWQAEHWISETRALALALAALRHGVNHREGRGLDELPASVLDRFGAALVRSMEPDELWRAFDVIVEELVDESGVADDDADPLVTELRGLQRPPVEEASGSAGAQMQE